MEGSQDTTEARRSGMIPVSDITTDSELPVLA